MSRNKKRQINGLIEKLEIILHVKNISNYNELANITDINSRTIEAWKNGKVVPHESTLAKFCEKLKFPHHWLKLDLKLFCSKMADQFSVDLDYLLNIADKLIEDAGYSILSSTRSAQHANWMEENFEKHYRGYWVGVHYWKKYSRNKVKKYAEETDPTDSNNKYIFRHLFHFHSYDSRSNTIKFKCASARQDVHEWNYRGHMIIALNKICYIMETTKKAEVEVLLFVTNRPSQDFENIAGLMLASTPRNEKTGDMSKPAAARIILQKINDPQIAEKEEECLEKLAGIFDENIFSKNTRELLKGECDPQVGILFPNYNEEFEVDEEYWKVENGD